MDDLFVFSEEPENTPDQYINHKKPWKVLIVDDEDEVHKITKLVLENFEFEARKLEMLHAYSAEEAIALLKQQPIGAPIAVAFIDVVMETDTAGLDLVKYIRHQLDNHTTRIILRTGQPGQAPEESVIRDYDINDYKSKTELTASKLKTTLYSSIRSFRDIMMIERQRMGLNKVLIEIANTSAESSLKGLTSQILGQIANVLDLEEDAMYCTVLSEPHSTDEASVEFKVLAKAGGLFGDLAIGEKCNLPDELKHLFLRAWNEKRSVRTIEDYVSYIGDDMGKANLLYVRKTPCFSELDLHLLDIFIDNFSKSYTALALKDEIERSQRELIYILGEAVEVRSKETGSHVKRVGEISYILAKAYGLDTTTCELIKLAAPLHDVGKVSIPDSILNKPGKHTYEEREIMRTHSEAGYNMLKQSQCVSLQKAAIIALEHHECWDGSGYPNRKSGEDINIMARITGLADVFDALGSKRCYKDCWPLNEIIEFIQQQKGKQFEPKLVDLLLENLDEIASVRERMPDTH
ncbi:HD domain-containing phosphohydrolase [Thiomicrorhabdus sediminis]|uniref:DUF3369 domain-containing protein n=1 Tax=Thiomicrorhabdus sediminis TaxID=2580412 RepID=A0A4P9K510_9GAMM|nr:HD domain-containing phosphohydrolase [Thiomicrorhabdus sediminis]QCU89307.1 DUF3369 domain-containing protein [Thiomicrorhabdus sediminis]